MAMALLIPVMALGMYHEWGKPEIIPLLAANDPASSPGDTAPHGQNQSTQDLPPMEELVKKLAAKLEKQPDNAEGWLMLGRSYMAMRQPGQAINAFERGSQVDPNNVTLLLAYAEALAQVSGNAFTGKAAELVEKAHRLNPKNPNGLWMMGIVAYQEKDYQGAIGYWEQVKPLLAPDNQDLNAIDSAIDEARAQIGMEPQLPSIVSANESPAMPVSSSDDQSIEVIIKLDPSLQDRVSPDDLVFIYAKAVAGPPMPLAAVRKKARDLPITIRLDDSMAMMPEMKLSSFSAVAVGARISFSGNPAAQSGDLEGEIKPVEAGQTGPVMVVIDSIHP
jgi:cytochrome c-type biogenesis protein CcmH